MMAGIFRAAALTRARLMAAQVCRARSAVVYRQSVRGYASRHVGKAEANTAKYAAVLSVAAAGFLAMTQDGWGGSKTKEAEKKSQAIDKVAGAASQKDGGENDDDWGAFLRELGFAEPAPEAGQAATPGSPAPPSATKSTQSTQDKSAAKEVGRELQNFSAKYVLVGAGTASHYAMRAILDSDPKAKILMIGEESDAPYMRPPLSKELWFSDGSAPGELKFKHWNNDERDVYFQPKNKYMAPDKLASADKGVALMINAKVIKLDADKQLLTLANGDTVAYGQLLIATGGHPRNLPVFERAAPEVKASVTLFRTANDYRHLDAVTRDKKTKTLVVVGGGFLGSELAVALAHRGKSSGMKVVQVFPETGNMAAAFPKYLSEWTMEKMREGGVDVRNKLEVDRCKPGTAGRVALTLSDGSTLEADHVVVAVGLEPNVELAAQGQLEIDAVDGGIMVNAELQARSHIYAAGDVASFFDPLLGRRRVEHHDHAVVTGKLAGSNMTKAAPVRYAHQSMFWSDLGPKIGYEAVGLIDSNLKTVGVWAYTPKNGEKQEDAEDTFEKGVVFYLRDKVVVGMILWNVFDKMDTARKILEARTPIDNTKQLARLIDVHQ